MGRYITPEKNELLMSNNIDFDLHAKTMLVCTKVFSTIPVVPQAWFSKYCLYNAGTHVLHL